MIPVAEHSVVYRDPYVPTGNVVLPHIPIITMAIAIHSHRAATRGVRASTRQTLGYPGGIEPTSLSFTMSVVLNVPTARSTRPRALTMQHVMHIISRAYMNSAGMKKIIAGDPGKDPAIFFSFIQSPGIFRSPASFGGSTSTK